MSGDKGDVRGTLLVLSGSVLRRSGDGSKRLCYVTPRLRGCAGVFNFRYSFVGTFFDPGFLCTLTSFGLDNRIGGCVTRDCLLSSRQFQCSGGAGRTGSIRFRQRVTSNAFCGRGGVGIFRSGDFPSSISQPIVIVGRQRVLRRVIRVFGGRRASCGVIVGPLFSRVGLGPRSLNVLERVFKGRGIFSFSKAGRVAISCRGCCRSSRCHPRITEGVLGEVCASR